MTELELESADRYQLISYLLAHVYPSAGAIYKDAARSMLQRQAEERLRKMAIDTCRQELERQEKRREMRARRRQDEHKHTTTRGAR